MKLLADATLPNITCFFKPPIELTLYHDESKLPSLLTNQDVLLCRSTLKVTSDLLAGSQIQCVATASSGIDHIDLAYLKSHHITLIDAKGSNARAVADYVTATLAFLEQKKLISGFRAGVVGLGEVGSRVALRLEAAGFEVLCYDPLKAMKEPDFNSVSMDELITCDLLCIHANLHTSHPFPTHNLFDRALLKRLKQNAIIINASRGGIVNEEALLTLDSPIIYCTDVYAQEPAVNAKLIEYTTLCTPHIAGHSLEAKQAAVIQVSQAIYQYFELPMPLIDIPKNNIEKKYVKPHWQETILSIYNPWDDTHVLKRSVDKKKAFLTQRQAHTTRHDFNQYDIPLVNELLAKLLGKV